jgi:hypothetical protein
VHVHERLTVRGVPDGPALDEAARLLDDVGVVLEPASIPALLALLALGDAGRVRDALAGDAEPWLLAFMLGRFVAWTGNLHFAAPMWARVRGSIDSPDPDPAQHDAAGLVLRAGALQAIANLATDLGDPQAAARVHSRVRVARSAALDQVAGAGPALRNVAAAAGFGADLPVATLNAEPVGLPTDVDTASAVVLHCAHALLGLDPDATRHRLRLRPHVPRTGVLHVTGIRFGDALVDLEVEAGDGRVVIRLDQVAGALPVTALLEPVVAAPVRAARVDGTPAELAARQNGEFFIVPVQLALDAPRHLELELES